MKATYTTAAGTEKVYDYGDRYSDTTRTDRRRSNGPKKGWQVAEMWDRHHEIARQILLNPLATNKEIGEIVGCTDQLVSMVKNSPVVKDKIEIMRAVSDAGAINLNSEIMALAPIALKRVKEAIESGQVLGRECSAKDILREANGVLDREMGKAVQRVDARHLHATLTPDDIERIKERATKLASESGQLG